MRQLVRAALPLGEGTVLDPFMGSGSTVAAALACGLPAIGLEQRHDYFAMAVQAVPELACLRTDEDGNGN
jgi:site-specific DNA-methyltransferase (adenine-specific)